MKKKMVIQADVATDYGVGETLKRVAGVAYGMVEMLRRYYSHVLERDVSIAQMRTLLEAQTAFFGCIMPADFHLMLRLVFGAWLLVALRKCRRVMGTR